MSLPASFITEQTDRTGAAVCSPSCHANNTADSAQPEQTTPRSAPEGNEAEAAGGFRLTLEKTKAQTHECVRLYIYLPQIDI